jgi:hypothetical protein
VVAERVPVRIVEDPHALLRLVLRRLDAGLGHPRPMSSVEKDMAELIRTHDSR